MRGLTRSFRKEDAWLEFVMNVESKLAGQHLDKLEPHTEKYSIGDQPTMEFMTTHFLEAYPQFAPKQKAVEVTEYPKSSFAGIRPISESPDESLAISPFDWRVDRWNCKLPPGCELRRRKRFVDPRRNVKCKIVKEGNRVIFPAKRR
ncbi:unnamed protein product [Periconia digitata]|uniref:Uncharacterized protein n=1 Tax=Periconia digitata TaxID=1303443 RepID=A0A9W4UBI0_9PLEO|nr:unnamed protein product [Periconia digitata]